MQMGASSKRGVGRQGEKGGRGRTVDVTPRGLLGVVLKRCSGGGKSATLLLLRACEEREGAMG